MRQPWICLFHYCFAHCTYSLSVEFVPSLLESEPGFPKAAPSRGSLIRFLFLQDGGKLYSWVLPWSLWCFLCEVLLTSIRDWCFHDNQVKSSHQLNTRKEFWSVKLCISRELLTSNIPSSQLLLPVSRLHLLLKGAVGWWDLFECEVKQINKPGS